LLQPFEGGLAELGVKPAEASGFYTRRRVNGEWITGVFPKGEVDAELRTRGRRARADARAAAPPAPREEARPRTRTRPATRPAELRRPAPQTRAAVAPPLVASPVELPAGPTAADATASTSAAPPTSEEHRLRLQQALERRAREMAEAGPKPSGPPVPRSVSFDFQTGLKTIVFEGDRVVREPFDPARVQPLALPGGAAQP
jgi:hypothetical protein